ncbi:MAG: hypothetical protein COT71_03420 [Candidatus Andersenbacteria bacterium CG10_big_fil_rev_8_21_14_0_10_54_11]|uniref:Uncharacterized protein n=1 Tax=Candidatus Andersenbacteria bacterium CG10_big_fil_rev_8_21_14_0_10_54_11 TaxID=1974485 RepID=A0A2M6WYX4_9BACT|nr:MAG: hypothetical protein COT71_03420 [Candidatus Andersenbacteria bacterium CG10_big_fil_rev_8_21_14_0_10_54_11]
MCISFKSKEKGWYTVSARHWRLMEEIHLYRQRQADMHYICQKNYIAILSYYVNNVNLCGI